jgi:signal transduction histidine kinase/phage shock protein PspC (stress-responsive transcriptional regulator)
VTDQPLSSSRLGGLAFPRSRVDRVLGGVAAGLGERMGIDPVVVRIGFVILSAAGGAGLLAYAGCWLVSHEPSDDAPPAARPPAPSVQQLAALGLIVLGTLVLLRGVGLWFGDALSWPVALAGAGSAVIWSRSDEQERARLAGLATRIPGDPLRTVLAGPASLPRVLVGGILLAAGMLTVLAANQALTFRAFGPVLLAMAVTTAGLSLLLGPWIVRLARQVTEERRERIRSEERAEVAAHLHDSVLQTLALIQRAEEPREMATLARSQERELRAWLYGGDADPARLRTAVEAAAAKVEQLHRVPVDAVVVGDAAVDDRVRALVQAATEAASNAARHSGADQVSLFAEVVDGAVVLYVTDQGKGFDPDAVPVGRHGIAESIRGRMARHGGTATITSHPGEGTEVGLRMPLEQP